MIREILFRGKTLGTIGWVCGCYYKYYGMHYIVHQDDAFLVDPDTIGQDTGLADKHGRMIFEGDILQTHSGIAVVVWDDAAFALQSPGSEAVDWEHSSYFQASTLIGNIYDNPELIKNGSL